MMLEKTLSEFCNNAETLIKNAAVNDDFVKIKTESGTAVLISEDEWNILVDAIKLHIAHL